LAKTEWGVKRICPSCGARYYDLLKSPPSCPTCNTAYNPEALLASRRSRPLPPDVRAKKIPVQERESLGVDVDEEVVALEQSDDAELAVDTIEVADDADEEAPEDVAELDGDDVEDVLAIEDDPAFIEE